MVPITGTDPDKKSVRAFIQKGLKKNQKEHGAESPYRGYQARLFDFNIKNVELLIKEGLDRSRYHHYYGIHENYSCICEIPDDVQDDWLDFAEDFANTYFRVLTQKPTTEYKEFSQQLIHVEDELAKLQNIFKRVYTIRANRQGISFEEYKKKKIEQEMEFQQMIADILQE